MKKGFTLIELLAVIVILAIIALIAVPIVLNIINEAKINANNQSIESYKKAIENSVANYMIKNPGQSLNKLKCSQSSDSKKLICDDIELMVDYSGNKVTCGLITITESGSVDTFCAVGEYEGYVGEIYRNTSESLVNNEYMNKENRWCIVSPGEYSSCVYNDYLVAVYSSKTGCEKSLEKLSTTGELVSIYENVICKQEALTYETDITNVSQNYYLKHDVIDNVVIASYVCITYTENNERKDVCIKGADPNYWETNQVILHNMERYFNSLDYRYGENGKGTCIFNESGSTSRCNSDLINVGVNTVGNAHIREDTLRCQIYKGGTSYCYEE